MLGRFLNITKRCEWIPCLLGKRRPLYFRSMTLHLLLHLLLIQVLLLLWVLHINRRHHGCIQWSIHHHHPLLGLLLKYKLNLFLLSIRIHLFPVFLIHERIQGRVALLQTTWFLIPLLLLFLLELFNDALVILDLLHSLVLFLLLLRWWFYLPIYHLVSNLSFVFYLWSHVSDSAF